MKRGVCLFQLRCVFNRGRFSGVSVGLLTIICNRVQLRLYHIVGHKTGMVSIDRLYHRTAAGSPPIAAFQKAGPAYRMVNACSFAFPHILKRLGILSKIMYQSFQSCGICKAKCLPVLPRKRRDLS